MNLTDFLKHYKIIIVLVNPYIETYKAGEFINEKLNDSFLSYDLPEDNNSDTMIVIPTVNETFNELNHKRFLKRNYTKFPSSLVIILGIKELLRINIEFLETLSSYRIPIIQFNPLIKNFVLDIHTNYESTYKNSFIYNKNNNAIHVFDFDSFINSIDKTNLIYCYYNDSNQNEWIDFFNKYMRILSMYNATYLNLTIEMKIE